MGRLYKYAGDVNIINNNIRKISIFKKEINKKLAFSKENEL